MTAPRNRQQFIDTIIQSPAAVKAHDKEAWLSIFARYNMVEDPVGSKPHISGGFDKKSGTRGHGALERFYDTYIAPNDITFQVERDIVCGYHVVRDIFLQIRMSPKISIDVPMHALYELTEEDGNLRIIRLAAHWELLPMVRQLMSKGLPSIGVLCSLGLRMLSIQGISGILGFMKGLSGIGETGKKQVRNFVDSFNNRQPDTIQAQFSNRNLKIEFPHGKSVITQKELQGIFNGRMAVSKIIAAGYVCSCSFTIDNSNELINGVAMFEFNASNRMIDIIRFYFE